MLGNVLQGRCVLVYAVPESKLVQRHFFSHRKGIFNVGYCAPFPFLRQFRVDLQHPI